ncbi:hypothetical protein [Flavobacterium sp. GCM10027622]|uniref:hypothetical protein n=1 Tax=unclassified Flavobacterium TaxID=196869 RepID=UPI003619F324
MKISKGEWLEIVENAISWIVVFAMMAYGLGKFVQFGNAHQIDKPVSQLNGGQLMWAFYAYSKPYALIIGGMEVIGGILLLFRKTRILGCFLITTILFNVILQDVFYGVPLGALRAAVLYQSCLLVILWLNKERVKSIIKSFMVVKPSIKPVKHKLILLFLTFVLFIIFRITEYYLTVY